MNLILTARGESATLPVTGNACWAVGDADQPDPVSRDSLVNIDHFGRNLVVPQLFGNSGLVSALVCGRPKWLCRRFISI
jgi:hypothetical protein